ncbi:MAG TPA: TauD/TfdA family dioxygenase, partial [Acidimicrobiales bacterium]|nr:TauD/TfdA family dioxygenase [Acidimicrobiales bacterium]
TVRGHELSGEVALDYHSDGSDLVGLLCLRRAYSGGLSYLANAVAIHNELVRSCPELALALYEPLPIDARGEQRAGASPYYCIPCFSKRDNRVFVRFNNEYVMASQRIPSAPHLTEVARNALAEVAALANHPDFHVSMDLQEGDIQFVNNYHLLHTRTSYKDAPALGYKRHLKRLWLESRLLTNRPVYFTDMFRPSHWEASRCISSIPLVPRPQSR